MSPDVAVLDYGAGNLFSVRRALEQCGASVIVSDDPEVILAAPRLVLPGVGAFADGMQGLADRGLIEPIRRYAQSGRPFLGICLGMQMLASWSEEFGTHEGLGVIPGRVVAIPATGTDGTPHRIPHIGWSILEKAAGLDSWDDSILRGLGADSAVYHVHSFTVFPDSDAHRLADWHYDGRLIGAAIRSGKIYGCQFHPEKSGPTGLHIVRNFLSE